MGKKKEQGGNEDVGEGSQVGEAADKIASIFDLEKS